MKAPMKLHFEPDLDFQRAAIDSVCDLFRGQEICRSEFTVTMTAPADVQQLGLTLALRAEGKKVACWNQDQTPQKYGFLDPDHVLQKPRRGQSFDCVIATSLSASAVSAGALPSCGCTATGVN